MAPSREICRCRPCMPELEHTDDRAVPVPHILPVRLAQPQAHLDFLRLCFWPATLDWVRAGELLRGLRVRLAIALCAKLPVALGLDQLFLAVPVCGFAFRDLLELAVLVVVVVAAIAVLRRRRRCLGPGRLLEVARPSAGR